MDSLDVEKLDLRDGTHADYVAKSKLIDAFYKDIIEAYYQSQKELYSDIAEELSKIKVKRKTK